jgi:hypothetical protein
VILRLQLKSKRNGQLLVWAVILLTASSIQAFTYRKGEVIPYDLLVDYSMSLAQHLSGEYTLESYTITVSIKDKEAIVRIEPKPKTPPPGHIIFDHSGLELHFREVDGGYEYTGGFKGI